ncbi:MAG TPA: hypothetical protein VNN73_18325 [Blastocatellia bacterium]|nr:hypothetical protein [Blastocatellia bacterium]
MSDLHQMKTVAVKACAACSRGLLEYDCFCRWCGARQPDFITGNQSSNADHLGAASIQSSPLVTSALEHTDANLNIYRRVSGPLVSAVVAGVTASAAEARGPVMRRMILALISIPVWLIIILLSPFDAYAAAKNLLR